MEKYTNLRCTGPADGCSCSQKKSGHWRQQKILPISLYGITDSQLAQNNTFTGSKKWPDGWTELWNMSMVLFIPICRVLRICISGRLAEWDIRTGLPWNHGTHPYGWNKHDTMDPKGNGSAGKMVKNGQYLYCPNGGPLAVWDDQKVFMEVSFNLLTKQQNKKWRLCCWSLRLNWSIL